MFKKKDEGAAPSDNNEFEKAFSEAPTPPEKPTAKAKRADASAEPEPAAPHEPPPAPAPTAPPAPDKLEQLRLAMVRLLAGTPENWAAWTSSATAAQVNEYQASRRHAQATLDNVFF